MYDSSFNGSVAFRVLPRNIWKSIQNLCVRNSTTCVVFSSATHNVYFYSANSATDCFILNNLFRRGWNMAKAGPGGEETVS